MKTLIYMRARKSLIGIVVICPIGRAQNTASSSRLITLNVAHGTWATAATKSGAYGSMPLIANGKSNGGIAKTGDSNGKGASASTTLLGIGVIKVKA
jgi:hypothetical protein